MADTGPLHCLVLIGEDVLLAKLFGTVVIPQTALDELLHPAAPHPVRAWASAPLPWLRVAEPSLPMDPDLQHLDAGEAAAIGLAARLEASLLLMDDRAGVAAARRRAINVTGTIGLLDLAAERRLVDLGRAVTRLRNTIRYRPALLDALLARHTG